GPPVSRRPPCTREVAEQVTGSIARTSLHPHATTAPFIPGTVAASWSKAFFRNQGPPLQAASAMTAHRLIGNTPSFIRYILTAWPAAARRRSRTAAPAPAEKIAFSAARSLRPIHAGLAQ